jgi:hypothetical protein
MQLPLSYQTEHIMTSSDDDKETKQDDIVIEERRLGALRHLSSWSYRTATVLVFVVVILGLIGSLNLATSSAKQDEASSLDMMSTARLFQDGHDADDSVRSCTFEECTSAACDFSLAPYLCLFHNGGYHGGCSPSHWTSDSCTESCDLSTCTSLKIPDNVHSCRGVECSKSWCSGEQVCSNKAAPYQCLDGPGRYGCSDDEYHWVTNNCPSCCDASLC